MPMTPHTTLADALAAIDAHKGPAETFTLAIADSLNDATGMTLAILTDRILARGWEPDGYEQRDGYRVYRYKTGEW